MANKFTVKFLSENEYGSWDQFVASSPDGSIYGTAEYLDIFCGITSSTFKILAVLKSDEIFGGIALSVFFLAFVIVPYGITFGDSYIPYILVGLPVALPVFFGFYYVRKRWKETLLLVGRRFGLAPGPFLVEESIMADFREHPRQCGLTSRNSVSGCYNDFFIRVGSTVSDNTYIIVRPAADYSMHHGMRMRFEHEIKISGSVRKAMQSREYRSIRDSWASSIGHKAMLYRHQLEEVRKGIPRHYRFGLKFAVFEKGVAFRISGNPLNSDKLADYLESAMRIMKYCHV